MTKSTTRQITGPDGKPRSVRIPRAPDVNGKPLRVGDTVIVAERGPKAVRRTVFAIAGDDMGPGFAGYVQVQGILGWANSRRFEKVAK